MSRATHPSIGITQERAATPSISPAQAPHSPSPQPYFGPFNSRSLRNTYSSAVSGAALTSWILPLTVRRIVGCAMRLVPLRWLQCKNRFNPLRGYRLHTNVQAGLSQSETCCPVYKQTGEAIEL